MKKNTRARISYCSDRLIRTIKPFFLKPVCSGKFSEEKSFLITSSPRSGSTWLGDLLNTIPNTCLLFEPLHLRKVPGVKEAGFSWRTYVPPHSTWPQGEQFLRRVFEGQVINAWTTRQMKFRQAFKADKLIVKSVRMNRLLPWICETFDTPGPVLLMRHPCAVIASQLKSSNWQNSKKSAPPSFIDYSSAIKAVLNRIKEPEEILAATWALDQLPALHQPPPRPFTIVTYEELFLEPKTTLQKICDAWNTGIDLQKVLAKINKPSSVVSASGIKGIDGWKKDLTQKQISNILNVTRDCGITCYTKDVEPAGFL